MQQSTARSRLILGALIALAFASTLCAQVDYGDYTFIVKNNVTLNAGHINSGALIGGDFSSSGETSFGQTNPGTNGFSLGLYGTMLTSNTIDMMGDNYYLANNTVSNSTGQWLVNNGALVKNPGSVIASDPLTAQGGFDGFYNALYGAAGFYASQTNSSSVSTNFSDQNSMKFILQTSAIPAISYITLDLNNPANGLATKVGSGASAVYTFNGNYNIVMEGASLTNQLVINVVADWGSTINFNSKTGASGKGTVLWNFVNQTNINLNPGDGFSGSVMATTSDVTYLSGSNIWGQVVANNFTATRGVEFHGEYGYSYFTNGLPPIPEPSTYGLMGAAACGAFALLRRRKKAA